MLVDSMAGGQCMVPGEGIAVEFHRKKQDHLRQGRSPQIYGVATMYHRQPHCRHFTFFVLSYVHVVPMTTICWCGGRTALTTHELRTCTVFQLRHMADQGQAKRTPNCIWNGGLSDGRRVGSWLNG
eukprot:scpid21810/ scgid31856/ 